MTSRTEVAGRYAGAVLELLGFAVIAWGLWEKLTRFSEANISDLIERWFGSGRTYSESVSDESLASDAVDPEIEAGADASEEHFREFLMQELGTIRPGMHDLCEEGREKRSRLRTESTRFGAKSTTSKKG